MPSSGLKGPFTLSAEGVNNAVREVYPGAYALGKTNELGTFIISYIGRADEDVNSRLQNHVTAWYPRFKYEYYSSAKAAFEKECELYHDFDPPDNSIHPARPRGTTYLCPRCGL